MANGAPDDAKEKDREMTLRVGFDMDGVLADFAFAYREVEHQLFGDVHSAAASAPEEDPASAGDGGAAPAANRGDEDRRRRAVWDQIRRTADFWTTLRAIEPDGIARLHALMLKHQWEVVFITQRPATAGDSVQRQTQRWLVHHGFDVPSVLVIAGSRGAAIHTLRLTHHIDDSPQNCVDVKTDSKALPILVARGGDHPTARQARKLGMGVATSLQECFEILESASARSAQSSVLRRLSALFTGA
jgi:beta-phosphoglucomutase-like phosphatase (HAD superfamily)